MDEDHCFYSWVKICAAGANMEENRQTDRSTAFTLAGKQNSNQCPGNVEFMTFTFNKDLVKCTNTVS